VGFVFIKISLDPMNIKPIKENLPEHFSHHNSFRRSDTVNETLYVICPVFNPHRYRTRWKLYQDFEQHVIQAGAHLVTIECSFGARQEVLAEQKAENHTVIHVYTDNELWLKENLINLAVQRLPKTAKYIAWVDGDIKFTRSDWVGETIQKLQHYHVVQMFSVCFELAPNFMPYQMSYGFVHDYLNGIPDKVKGDDWDCYYEPPAKPKELKVNRYHPGYAWAYTIEAWNWLGGLIDTAILGSADNHMARALIGQFEKSCPANVTEQYKETIKVWQDRAMELVKKDIGYVEGQINHYFHGAKKHRKYKDRWKILVDNQYNPHLDLKRFFNGTWQLTDRNIQLRDDIRAYFAQRNEDSIDLDVNDKFIGM
jgi:hypothetical protein